MGVGEKLRMLRVGRLYRFVLLGFRKRGGQVGAAIELAEKEVD